MLSQTYGSLKTKRSVSGNLASSARGKKSRLSVSSEEEEYEMEVKAQVQSILETRFLPGGCQEYRIKFVPLKPRWVDKSFVEKNFPKLVEIFNEDGKKSEDNDEEIVTSTSNDLFHSGTMSKARSDTSELASDIISKSHNFTEDLERESISSSHISTSSDSNGPLFVDGMQVTMVDNRNADVFEESSSVEAGMLSALEETRFTENGPPKSANYLEDLSSIDFTAQQKPIIDFDDGPTSFFATSTNECCTAKDNPVHLVDIGDIFFRQAETFDSQANNQKVSEADQEVKNIDQFHTYIRDALKELKLEITEKKGSTPMRQTFTLTENH